MTGLPVPRSPEAIQMSTSAHPAPHQRDRLSVVHENPGATIEDLRILVADLTAMLANASAELAVIGPLVVASQQQPSVDPKLLTVEQTAKILNVSRTTIFALIREGRLRSLKLDGKRRVRPEAVEAFISDAEPTSTRAGATR